MALNTILVITTISSPTLHSTCNWLIAAAAACDVVHQSGHFLPFYNVLTGRNFMNVVDCCTAQMPSLFSYGVMLFLLGCIALDRLLSVLFPTV